jgi:glycosyltransferase involved in cell wall biosynthesis
MDDCSPDNTPEIASTFTDPRVRYIRNENNLGHLCNYNKGITLSRGKYVWLISADDRLRRPYLLQRYVHIMDDNPRIGYACCPAVKLKEDVETGIESRLVTKDTIFVGKDFLRTLLKGNFIIAASGMVRRICYENHGSFPLDLPYAGDWFLWCLFALYYDVAYFAEPMVNYRSHELSMTNYLMNRRAALTLREGFSVLWRIRNQAREAGDIKIARRCEYHLARLYGSHLAGGKEGGWTYRLTEEEFEASLLQGNIVGAEQKRIKAGAWVAAGDCKVKRHELAVAGKYYKRALELDRWMVGTRARQLVLRTGAVGIGLIRTFTKLRKTVLN